MAKELEGGTERHKNETFCKTDPRGKVVGLHPETSLKCAGHTCAHDSGLTEAGVDCGVKTLSVSITCPKKLTNLKKLRQARIIISCQSLKEIL